MKRERELLYIPPRYGVLDTEIIVNSRSGRVGVRAELGEVMAAGPEATTNAFVAWVGHHVVVVSAGVERANMARIAEAIRTFFGREDVPVVFHLPSTSAETEYVTAHCTTPVEGRALARAGAYVLVQCGLVEREVISVDLDGAEYQFRVEYHPKDDGGWAPVVV